MRTEPPSLLPFFRSELQLRMLGLIVLDPEVQWTADSLATVLDAPSASVHRELHRALDANLIVRDERRRPHTYRPSETNHLLAPLRTLLEGTVGIERELRAELARTDGVEAAVLHGSWLSGKHHGASDIDVFAVGDVDLPDLRRRLRAVGRRAGRPIDLVVFSRDEFRAGDGAGFVAQVRKGPRLDLVGRLEDLD